MLPCGQEGMGNNQKQSSCVYSSFVGKSDFGMVSIKVIAPWSSRGQSQAWEGISSLHEVVAVERLLPLCDVV
jgi:hypothetical protein